MKRAGALLFLVVAAVVTTGIATASTPPAFKPPCPKGPFTVSNFKVPAPKTADVFVFEAHLKPGATGPGVCNVAQPPSGPPTIRSAATVSKPIPTKTGSSVAVVVVLNNLASLPKKDRALGSAQDATVDIQTLSYTDQVSTIEQATNLTCAQKKAILMGADLHAFKDQLHLKDTFTVALYYTLNAAHSNEGRTIIEYVLKRLPC